MRSGKSNPEKAHREEPAGERLRYCGMKCGRQHGANKGGKAEYSPA
ncbi:MAG: hypothetical protein IJ129_03260 [Ruminococcus sp.]|nr:hypothetical protein [Ruminococcus sp.]